MRFRTILMSVLVVELPLTVTFGTASGTEGSASARVRACGANNLKAPLSCAMRA